MAFGSGVFLAIDLNLWHRSIADLGAGLATVLANTQVVWVGLLAWAVHRERPTRAALVGVPLAVAGVALAGGLGRGDAYGAAPARGALLAALTGLAYAFFLLGLRASQRRGGGVARPLFDATLGTAAAGLALSPLDPAFSLAPTLPAHAWLVALAVVSHTGGWLLIARALARLPAIETSLLLLVQPCLTMAWGVLIFVESPSPWQWSGVALVLIAVAGASAAGAARPGATASDAA